VPSSSWCVVADPRAAQDLKKLRRQHHPALSALISAIDALPSNPYAGKPLTGDKRGSFSLRIGDFRIIYDLYAAEHTIHLIRVGDRKEIYR
jgi:mRNA interferase RelE/StbE